MNINRRSVGGYIAFVRGLSELAQILGQLSKIIRIV